MPSQRFPTQHPLRYLLIGIVLLLGIYWSLASAMAGSTEPAYPQKNYLVTADWLKEHIEDDGLVVVDVRADEYFDNRLIPGAIHLPWSNFRYTDTVRGIGGKFVGLEQAQKILGNAGLSPNDTLVLYDSIERDGGATASYVFWVLDLLGHPDKKILERGVDGWTAAGGETSQTPERPEAMLYQAPTENIRLQRRVAGEFIQSRLGDPYYQILDVRSRPEYLGEKPNVGVDGEVLKLGHIPTAVNVDYRLNWTDADTKAFKSYGELLELYRGLDPSMAVITYCHSARRGSFGYFTLRLMGFEDVRLYDGSWFEWGQPELFYPVETSENRMGSEPLPEIAGGVRRRATETETTQDRNRSNRPDGPGEGYVSCGG